jgi:hypothetical protein
MTIQERLNTDLKQAMRDRDKLRVDVIRSARDALQKAQLEAARQHYETSARQIEQEQAHDPKARDEALAKIGSNYHAPLDEATQEAVIIKQVKQRHDSAAVYRKAGDNERAEQEEAEARILETYLPQQLDAEALRPQIATVISDMGLHGPQDMGKLMPVLMERFKGRADARLLSQLARELLSEA